MHGPLRALITACLAKTPADRPTTAQLLEQITSHWDPPGDFHHTIPWPPKVATLIATHTAPSTLRYTLPTAGTREDLSHPHQQAQQTNQAAGPREAARLFAELAADHARALGPDHPDTLRSRHSRAWNLGQAGEHGEAARLMAEVAADRVRVQGPDHPDTLQSRDQHARNPGKAGEERRS
ncbi:tetratricopeptide repeat protein [Streptomyces sp. NPDC056255]|uniref:tetratricopeptide repeat protein n=1 Tax=Streptomyces sp. NPDC056255 TaxID=3345764 RepID=UPI0035E2DC6E